MKTKVSNLHKLRRVYWSERSVLFYSLLCVICLGGAAFELKWSKLLGLVFCGWLIYLLEEYLSHVTFFHGVMPRNRFLYRLLYRLHHGHHDKPRRLDLLFTPIWYTLPALCLNAICFALITKSVNETMALTSGLVLGYLMFEWWHLIVHSPYEPGAILRYVRHQHMGHHYWNERRWYTISPPAIVLDVLFGTAGSVQQSPRSENPRTAGLTENDERLLMAREYYRGGSDWTEDESLIWKTQSSLQMNEDN